MSSNKNKKYVVGHKKPDTDSIASAIGYANYKKEESGINAVPVRAGELNPETKFVLDKFDVEKPSILEDASDKDLILVDHNEINQAVDNVKDANIVEVLDHHRIAGIETESPIYFHTEPIGSTSTMVAEKYLNSDIRLEESIAGVLLSAILSDTVVHRSPTNTKRDEEIASKLADLVNVGIEEYGKEMLKKKSKIGKKSPKEIILGDFKEYEIGKEFIGIGQVETVTPEEVIDQKEDLIKEMESISNERGYDLLLLLITDLLEEDSEALTVGPKSKAIEDAFDTKIENQSTFLEGVLSRKKQVVPRLRKKFK
ncbi:MAG: Inorganic pyrophosphatase/exopolyphosphatase [Candidatus Methanohalarchaeum thermophilum]|uniref:inorganic diphosphatase n=1 Tax=Methanohalarchaeum thermophilum TaxID=1903181 RepID=A0A1Q6DUT7_METT1|nr:MAG: Inorganic pyrophosphatase/exopolyphosphatase [Candidatus Methanohalarchaeum thermophilum]